MKKPMKNNVNINDEFITLSQLLKITNLVSSGGEVKSFLKENEVYINDVLDQRRGKKLYKDDVIKIKGNEYIIC